MLAAEAEAIFARIDAAAAATPQEARPRAYLARGPDGLETAVVGSINTEIIERAGGVNVVGEGAAQRGIVARPRAGLDGELLAWDPDTIVTRDANFFDRVWTDPLWQGVKRWSGAVCSSRRSRPSAGSTARPRSTA